MHLSAGSTTRLAHRQNQRPWRCARRAARWLALALWGVGLWPGERQGLASPTLPSGAFAAAYTAPAGPRLVPLPPPAVELTAEGPLGPPETAEPATAAEAIEFPGPSGASETLAPSAASPAYRTWSPVEAFDAAGNAPAAGDSSSYDEPRLPGSVAAGYPAQVEEDEAWNWRLLPTGLLYRSYLAGNWEPRLASAWNYTQSQGWLWDLTLGGRVGLVRYGTQRDYRPEGFQLDIEGAAITRLDFRNELDVSATDYRAGIPLTYARGRWATKFAFYHLSSHLGDEFLLKNPGYPRINYSRNALVWGNAWWWSDNVRIYGEIDWAFYTDGGSKPWATLFGVEYAPAQLTGLRPVPFWAVHGNLRQEVDWGGNLSCQAGWMWRGGLAGRIFRLGMDYYNGKSRQLSLFNTFEQQVGMGVWYDY